MTFSATRAKSSLLGALAADAATMPLHWVYGFPAVRAALESDPTISFRSKLSCPFYDENKFPGHYGKAGQPSPYGEEFAFTIEHVEVESPQKLADEMEKWAKTFGGRPNHCTVEFLEKRSRGEEFPGCGAVDKQMNSVIKAVAFAAGFAGRKELKTRLEQAVRVHQNDDVSVAFALAAARALELVILGKASVEDAIINVDSEAPQFVKDSVAMAVKHAKATEEDFAQAVVDNVDPNVVKEEMHRKLAPFACGLPDAYTTCVYLILSKPGQSYTEIVERNIMFSGDNCSRGIFLGALKAAEMENSVPSDWIKKTVLVERLGATLDSIVSKGAGL